MPPLVQHAPNERLERVQAVVTKDTRHPVERMRDAIVERSTTGALLFGLAGACVFFPSWSNGFLMAGILLFSVGLFASRREALPFRLPESVGQIDYNDPLPGRMKFAQARGIYFIGNAIQGMHELWQSGHDALTHRLVFGTTGSGKTENLLSNAWTFLCTGSGVIYIDPKASPKLPMQITRMARMLGRDDDLRFINFFVGQPTTDDWKNVRLGNTTNPFSIGNAEGLAQLVAGLIPHNKGENALFSERAIALINTLMYALVEYRDRGDIMLSVRELAAWLTLERCMRVAGDESLSERSRNSMRTYLSSLPGFDADAAVGDQPQEVARQFGFAQAYFTRSLLSLTDTYGQIFDVKAGEVDWLDVVLNRRILVVLLPAMEKPPSELQNLGKIVLTALRNAMAAGLGSGIEGTVEDVLDTLPTASNTPTACIVDEYAYVSTEGFAVTAAQARGLGFSVTFAGQDYAGMERASKEEAEQIFANTKLKELMALEDPQKTWEVFHKLSGEAYHSETAGHQVNKEGVSSIYFDQLSSNMHRRHRIDIRDLQQQIEGEAHIFFKGQIVRANVFYADVSLPSTAELRVHRHLILHRSPNTGTGAGKARSILNLLDRLQAMEETPTAAIGIDPATQAIADAVQGAYSSMDVLAENVIRAWEAATAPPDTANTDPAESATATVAPPASLGEAVKGMQAAKPPSALATVFEDKGQWAWGDNTDAVSRRVLGETFPAAIAAIAREMLTGVGTEIQREVEKTAEEVARAVVYPVKPFPKPLDNEVRLATALLETVDGESDT